MSELNLNKISDLVGSIKSEIYISHIKNEEEMNKNIIETIDKEVGKNDYKTNVKAQMTDWEMHNYPGFDRLSHIINEVGNVLNKNDTYKFKLENIWGCKYKSNEETFDHDHWPNVWSIVYYLYPPENCSELVFTEFNYSLKPEHGMLVIFPGYYKHQVIKKPFEGYRYVVSANIR